MLKNKQMWSGIITIVLLLGGNNIAMAEKVEKSSESVNQFRRIEQPKAVKIGVTLGGLALIGAELWWFLFSKTKAQKAKSSRGIQEVNITVDGGYIPERIVVKAGEPVRLNFFRKDPSNCLEKVLLPDFHKAADLSLNETTAVEFTPEKTGNYTFNCGMNMFRGVIEVREEIEKDVVEVKERVGSTTSS
ncbi:MAG: cupredoxin domain-containing protein [Prochloraceae cyanobacterium]|nr:cupredoxin domain-containing protein [Prochloraceae cyanobacterium]